MYYYLHSLKKFNTPSCCVDTQNNIIWCYYRIIYSIIVALLLVGNYKKKDTDC
jgi:hypothetical protein